MAVSHSFFIASALWSLGQGQRKVKGQPFQTLKIQNRHSYSFKILQRVCTWLYLIRVWSTAHWDLYAKVSEGSKVNPCKHYRATTVKTIYFKFCRELISLQVAVFHSLLINIALWPLAQGLPHHLKWFQMISCKPSIHSDHTSMSWWLWTVKTGSAMISWHF